MYVRMYVCMYVCMYNSKSFIEKKKKKNQQQPRIQDQRARGACYSLVTRLYIRRVDPVILKEVISHGPGLHNCL